MAAAHHQPTLAVIAGVGPGIGAAVARAFAARGHAPPFGGTKARAFACDISSDASQRAAFAAIAAAFPDHRLQVAVFNASNFVRAPFLETTREQWDAAALALTQILAATPTPTSPPPTLIFTGATAALRGAALFSTFAVQKFALRALSQSLAREFGPRGVHVVHAIVDGMAVARAYVFAAEQDRSAWTQEIDLRPFSEKF
ncbi:hypothetical protein DFJ73DRAFT_955206 [Zopfochytrium polystomum]|nr:hypothetical protein DFJ73DRAFT_955206 [Zopfochytrium polystomum]